MNGKETKKMYVHGTPVGVSLFEYMMANDPADFQIDTSYLFKIEDSDGAPKQKNTLDCVREMAKGGGVSFSYLSLVKNNPDIACMLHTYKDMYLVPTSDIVIKVTKDMYEASSMYNFPDDVITIKLSEYFCPINTPATEMKSQYYSTCGHGVDPKIFVDNVIVC
ncbi:MAG: hypothetical protein ACRCX2_04875 [Paraclostridium sp.]